MEPSMKTRLSLLVLVAVALVVGLFLNSGRVGATPPVSWQPKPFDIAVPPGGRLVTKFTATITKSIPSSRVEVTPSLAPYVVSVKPATLPALSAGSTTTVEIVFAVATGTPHGTIEGTLHLKETGGKGKGTQAQPLAITLTIGNLLYPPDPGEAGKVTLEGIDSDGDGIRDDIQRYIEITYPDEPLVKAALRQDTIPLQAKLLDAHSEEKSLLHHEETERSQECLGALFGTERGFDLAFAMQAEMLNTDARSRAYILYNSQLSGHIFSGPAVDDISACDFDPQEEGVR
jgi:hypothetical protein